MFSPEDSPFDLHCMVCRLGSLGVVILKKLRAGDSHFMRVSRRNVSFSRWSGSMSSTLHFSSFGRKFIVLFFTCPLLKNHQIEWLNFDGQWMKNALIETNAYNFLATKQVGCNRIYGQLMVRCFGQIRQLQADDCNYHPIGAWSWP